VSSALEFQDVTKDFRGARRYRSLREDVAATAGKLVGRNGHRRAVVRALDDISFAVAQGSSYGIIGPNGAGKTTALKLATRVSYPTEGKVRVRGRVGALIEVGTGMHPELTGRENVQLYGRILGLKGREIASRFDEIVEFAGVGQAIDQPVKQFSSGMQLRLGFSIAAHLEPDVLLVDEALAVGDAAFQTRCVAKMGELVRGGGTLVFVSHDLLAIESLCERAILLNKGKIVTEGPAREVVAHYVRGLDQQDLVLAPKRRWTPGNDLQILSVVVYDELGVETDAVPADTPVTIRVNYRADVPIEEPHFTVGFGDGRRGAFASASMLVDGETPARIEGEGFVECTFDGLPFYPRMYELWCAVRGQDVHDQLVRWQRIRLFEVTGDDEAGRAAYAWGLRTPVRLPYRWNIDGAA
jgi:ABC-type polysaccharide/polyol phosphate transport system ATPase subunit